MSTALERKWDAAVASIGECMLCGATSHLQVSHSNMLRGLGSRSAPWNTARLCEKCHTEIDNGKLLTQEQRRALHLLAIVKTHDRLIRERAMVLA